MCPTVPISASDIPSHPGLIQWLALADRKQCRPMVETCLDKMFPAAEANDPAACRSVMRKTLISPHLRRLVSLALPGIAPSMKLHLQFDSYLYLRFESILYLQFDSYLDSYLYLQLVSYLLRWTG